MTVAKVVDGVVVIGVVVVTAVVVISCVVVALVDISAVVVGTVVVVALVVGTVTKIVASTVVVVIGATTNSIGLSSENTLDSSLQTPFPTPPSNKSPKFKLVSPSNHPINSVTLE